jgi:transcriptional regulator with XRE-family HTH domain
MDIYDRINDLLKKQSKTRKDLCDSTGISYNTLTSLFQRRSENIKLQTLIKIAEFLEVSLDWLIDGDQTESVSLDDIQTELLGILNSLSVKDKVSLLSFAYDLQKNSLKNKE